MKKFLILSVVALARVERGSDGGAREARQERRRRADICVLLPDTEVVGPLGDAGRPALVTAFKKAGVSYVITNADGDAQKQKTQADQCLANGAKVVILVSLDAGSSIAIEKAAQAAGCEGDRVRPPGQGRHVGDLHLVRRPPVGVLQGTGVVAGLKANGKYGKKPVVAELNGGQTDNNSYLFKGGYDSILNPLYKSGTFKKGPDQFTPGWDNQKALTIFQQMLIKTNNNIQAVAAANDGLANGVVTALKAKGLKPIPLSGQDATEQGVQNIISGWQTMTVWKDTRVLAAKSAAAAIALLNGKKPVQTGTVRRTAAGEAAGVHHPAGRDHEGELPAAVQRLPEEERRLQGRVREVLRQACIV